MSLCFSFPSVKGGIAMASLVRIQLRNASTVPSAAWPGVRRQQALGALPSHPCTGGAGGSEPQIGPCSCPVWQKTPGLGQGDVSSNLPPPCEVPGACPSPGQQCRRGQVLRQPSVGRRLLPALWMREPCGWPLPPSPRAEASLAQGSEWAGL